MQPAWTLLALSLLSATVSRAAEPPCAIPKAVIRLDDSSFADGVLRAHGSWEAPGANAVALEYRIDQDRQQVEIRSGQSGTWEVALPWTNCGLHTLRVYAFPVVPAGEGRMLHCLDRSSSAPAKYTVNCAPVAELADCRWECTGEEADSRCSGTCAASAKGGRPPYVPFWGVDNQDFQPVLPPGEGPWTQPVACSPGQKISLKVRDYHGTGAWSAVVEKDCGQ